MELVNEMTTDTTVEQLFKRLDQLKEKVEALYHQASPFVQIAQALRDPLNNRIGEQGVIGYGRFMVDVNLPDIDDLSEQVKSLQQEHHDLKVSASVLLDGTAKEYFLQQLDDMRSGLKEGEDGLQSR